jgi:PAS domain S-box-containing protein
LNSSTCSAENAYSDFEVLWEGADHAFCRTWRSEVDRSHRCVLAVMPAAEHPTRASLDRLEHEYELKDELEGGWAVRPLALTRQGGRLMLVLEDFGGEPLEPLLDAPMELGRFLRLAIGIVVALGKAHQRGLIHKDVKPANILVNRTSGEVRLTGFGIATRFPRERQIPEPPEVIAGTLAYMAPEQTGRMNRCIDARSDLYALGGTFYQMLTGTLPFVAGDPMEWVHCHIARTPVPPSERLPTIPIVVSAIVMKLLAKTVEERYQTATGVGHDLRQCLAEWEARDRVEDFRLGQRDTPDRLVIPEKLYGRAHDVDALLAAFDRVVKSGTPELVLVSGYAGIGKSSLVNEVHKVLLPPRGLFASGKFDQYKRNIPYSTLAQAFQGLIRSLLGKSEAELAAWREALQEALGSNARLIVDLVPEVRLLTGDPPPVPELSPQDERRRFQLVVRRFIGVFARPEHPLALFLDDLQWLDTATLEVFEDLLLQPDVRYLLLVGAYRANEVSSTHPLTRKLDAIRQAGARVQEICLAPLARDDVGQLVGDALHCEPATTASLAQLVHDKTAGNPFFLIQFLSALAEEGLLAFDHDEARWCWDHDRIQGKGYTDNVVDLMVKKISRFSSATQQVLEQLACLGNCATIATLALVCRASEQEVQVHLWEPLRQELIVRGEGSYGFVHDRIQEAAYVLVPESLRAEAHLRIGRLLAAHTPAELREEAIFEIVNQFNRASHLITTAQEREQVAELNLIAGQRAKVSTAYASALTYLTDGTAFLAADCWETRHQLAFALELRRAECEFLTGALAEADERLAGLSARAATTIEHATVTCLRVDLYLTLGQEGRAIAVGLDYLRHVGIDWSPHPTENEARREYERIWSQLGSRKIEELIELPLMSDPVSLATLDVLSKMIPPAVFTDPNLHLLLACRQVNLSLEHGNCDASCIAYEWLATFAGARFGDYQAGYRFGRLGYELVEQRGLTRFQASTQLIFAGGVLPWTRHIKNGHDLLRRAFEAANKIGDLPWAAYSCVQLSFHMLTAGDPLIEVQREIEHGLEFARKARFGLAIDLTSAELGLVRTLRGLTRQIGSFDDELSDEREKERRLADNPDLAVSACWYYRCKLQARFFAGEYASAVEAASRVQSLLWAQTLQFNKAEYHFYSALSRAASCESASREQRRQHLEAITADHRQLEELAPNCPDNFENRALLVSAEIARLEGRDRDAMNLYERAIRSARDSGFVQIEALTYELAARFYRAQGFEDFARLYLQHARDCYLRWGADGKVRQLDGLYPHLRTQTLPPDPKGTIAAPVEQLDLATVIKVSQSVSGEIVLEKLIDTLMCTALEQAGAERGLLALSYGAELRIAAEATSGGYAVRVRLCEEPVAEGEVPASVFQYVLRTRESVILKDAAGASPFTEDPYVRRHQARSILCLPLLNQAKLTGVLYLENNLAARVFAPAQVAVLKLIASQATIALENTRLYRDLAEREARIRRLLDANIIGIFFSDAEDRIVEANDAFLRIIGYDREDLVSGSIRWTDLTPPEWLKRDEQQWIPELDRSRVLPPFEKEYFRKDGSRVPVLIGVASLEHTGYQAVTFVLDLSESKRDERELRRITDAIAQIIVVENPDGIPIYANQALLDYTGLTIEDVMTSDFRARVLHPEDLERLREMRKAALLRGLPFEMEARALRKDGQYRWFLAHLNPFRDEEGQLVRWYVTGTDIEERKRAEDRIRNENVALREEVDRASMFEEIVGASDAIRYVLGQVAKVAPTESTVLILGETGTGKELVARAIHKKSQRASRPFVAVNCAAIPPPLIASEFFGHEKGAFTGALQRRQGRFELAEGGTIFLDEVGELPPETQISLLRVLQEREFERVGGNQTLRANVRIIAATNRDLQSAIAAGGFRSDLFYRLSVFPIDMPALRERREDIPLLVEYFIHHYANQAGQTIKRIEKKSLELLQAYAWPGNIRELQNVIERSLIVCETETLSINDRWLASLPTQPQGSSRSLANKTNAEQRAIVETALREAAGKVSGPSGAAAKLGIPASTLESKIRVMRINKHRFKSDLGAS